MGEGPAAVGHLMGGQPRQRRPHGRLAALRAAVLGHQALARRLAAARQRVAAVRAHRGQKIVSRSFLESQIVELDRHGRRLDALNRRHPGVRLDRVLDRDHVVGNGIEVDGLQRLVHQVLEFLGRLVRRDHQLTQCLRGGRRQGEDRQQNQQRHVDDHAGQPTGCLPHQFPHPGRHRPKPARPFLLGQRTSIRRRLLRILLLRLGFGLLGRCFVRSALAVGCRHDGGIGFRRHVVVGLGRSVRRRRAILAIDPHVLPRAYLCLGRRIFGHDSSHSAGSSGARRRPAPLRLTLILPQRNEPRATPGGTRKGCLSRAWSSLYLHWSLVLSHWPFYRASGELIP